MPETPTPPLHVLCSACGHMGCEHQAEKMRTLALRVQQLEAAARQVLLMGELGVSEDEGVRRMQFLARLIGYAAGPQPNATPIPRDDLRRAASECGRLFKLVAEEIEIPGSAWHVALFLYADPPAPGLPGHVIAGRRDNDGAVARIDDDLTWLGQ